MRFFKKRPKVFCENCEHYLKYDHYFIFDSKLEPYMFIGAVDIRSYIYSQCKNGVCNAPQNIKTGYSPIRSYEYHKYSPVFLNKNNNCKYYEIKKMENEDEDIVEKFDME